MSTKQEEPAKPKPKPKPKLKRKRSTNHDDVHQTNSASRDSSRFLAPVNFPPRQSRPLVEGEANSFVDVLWWKCRDEHVPLASEEIMVDVLVQRGKKERGMMKDQLPHRLEKIQKRLQQSAHGLRLDQALSLRRHHMKLLNPKMPMTALRLGNGSDINAAAELFEHAVEIFLQEQHVAYINEHDQRSGGLVVLTPDFVLPRPIELNTFRHLPNGERQVIASRQIYWIEVKMFYGASTIPAGTPGAVGTLLPKAEKYVKQLGPGAVAFLNGCGDQLAEELARAGVTALSASALPSRLLQPMRRHQQVWCGREGQILP